MATSSVYSGRSAMDIGQEFQSKAIQARSAMRPGSGDPGKTAGGFIGAAAGGAAAGAGIGTMVAGEAAAEAGGLAAVGGAAFPVAGAIVLGLSYLLS